jgi:hypothetical protein
MGPGFCALPPLPDNCGIEQVSNTDARHRWNLTHPHLMPANFSLATDFLQSGSVPSNPRRDRSIGLRG